jgi:DNA-binding SARP family transcriptional activator
MAVTMQERIMRPRLVVMPVVAAASSHLTPVTFEFDVLGELRLRFCGCSVELRPMERMTVIALLTAPGYSLAALKLAARLWEGDVSDAAVLTARSHVSHAREAVREVVAAVGDGDEAQLIVTARDRGGWTYRLNAKAENTDVYRFEKQVATGCRQLQEGLHQQAFAALDDALSLWRGEPLQDAADMSFAQAEIRRLTNPHRAARVARAEAGIALGWYWELLSELWSMAAEWPDDSKVWHLLVTCLWRSHRDGEAAIACKESVKAFQDRGLDTRQLEKLQRDVLNGALPR